MDLDEVVRWVEQYVRAWNSNDPGDIGRLFTVDALYYTGPFDAPWRGREAIVREWLGRRDAPGDANFRYEVLATSGDVGIVRGWTQYHQPPREYSNVWFVRLDPGGACREFTEWWMQRPDS